MNEQIKMTDSELTEVQTLQNKFQQKMFQFGQLYLQKIQTEKTLKYISEQEVILEGEWTTLQKEENSLIETLLKKYGEGSLDLKAGTFISDKKL